jgi:hypothetical protein
MPSHDRSSHSVALVGQRGHPILPTQLAHPASRQTTRHVDPGRCSRDRIIVAFLFESGSFAIAVDMAAIEVALDAFRSTVATRMVVPTVS